MKRVIVLSAIALISFASCNREIDIVRQGAESPVFHATTESNTGTKAYLTEDLSVAWNQGDLISLFNKTSANEKYRFAGADGDLSGDFVKVSEGDGSDPAISKVLAVYPYHPEAAIGDDEAVVVLLPSEQAYRENSFGVGANTMIAASDDTELLFKNLCGYLRVRLYGEDISISKVAITGHKNEILAGQAVVTVGSDGIPTARMITDPDNAYVSEKVVINCDAVSLGTTAETATEFCFVIPPGTFSAGFTLTVFGYQGGQFGRYEISTPNSVAITRNVRRTMAALDVALEPVEVVEFEDEIFKAYCVANFDDDGDGEVSLEEAFRVAEIQCPGCSSLKGIEAFVNLVTLDVSAPGDEPGTLTSLDLRQNTMLRSVNVSHNALETLDLTGLDQLEIVDCSGTKLTALDLSDHPSLSNVDCSGCSELEELNLSGSAVNGSITWTDCTAMKKVLLSNTQLVSLPGDSFMGLSNLEELDLSGSNYEGSLDLSANTNLKTLNVSNIAALTEIKVAARGELEDFNCAESGVTSLVLDELSKLNNFACFDCGDLESLTITDCRISNSVSWTGCDELKTLNLSGTTFISWPAGDLVVFPALENLDISDTNYDRDLDMSCNGGINTLNCENAGVTSINVQGLPELQDLNCSKNSITALDVSGLNKLESLNFQGCKIETVDIHKCNNLTKLTAWPQNEVNLASVTLSSNQSDNLGSGDLKLYDTAGEMSVEQMSERYHTELIVQ